jgi:eukaryotic-like serine/threonine-protein kinase
VAIPQFIGRYEIIGSIGSGGMGTLLRARDPKIGGRTVAIKLLKEGIDNEEIRRRFMQEANAAGVLEHENIVRIFDVGEQDGEPFIAMEFIDGETLSQWIRRREPAAVARKLRLIEELCDGLAYAHSFNIVHRDVKPANLMVEKRRGRLKILDFGIAKLADSGITNAGALIGSFNYMSPEQVRGLPIDHRSDIFSVGAVMFELLCYKQAFPGGLGDGVLGRIAEQPAPKLRAVMPDADPEVEQIINRALEKDPGRRYPDLPAMHRDLTRVRRRLDRDEPSGETRVELPPSAHRSGQTPVPQTPRPTPQGPGADRRAQLRAQQVAQHMDAALKAFEAGRYEEAIAHTENASAVDEEDPRPHELRTRAEGALADQQAQAFLTEAQAALQRGDIDGADSFVGRAIDVRPGHTGIGVMREAVARARNQAALASTLQRARAALQAQEWTAAIRLGNEAELFAPGSTEVRAIRQRAEAAIAEAEARERHRQEQERARQERVRVEVESARRAIVHGKFEEAGGHADQAARDGVDARTLDQLRLEIQLGKQQAESAARRSAQAAALLGEALAKFNAGEYRAAIVRCDAALRIVPDDGQALDLRRRAQLAIEEDEERRRQAEAAEQRRLADEAAQRAREEHDRAAHAELEAARHEFDAGQHDAAIARLQRFAPPHEDVTQGIAALRAELTALQDEQRRQQAAAEARAIEDQRQARLARAAALAGTARELASAGQYAEALNTLAEAARLDGGNTEYQELTRQIQAAKAARDAVERRARDLAAKVAEAESRLAAGDVAKARRRAEEARAIDAESPAVADLFARIAAAETQAEQQRAAERAAAEQQRLAAEQQRAAERAAAEAARLAKERDQKVNALIAKARKAKRAAEALGFLEEAQRVDPQRGELGALIAERQAEIARAKQPPPTPARPAERPDVGPVIPEPSRRPGLSPAVLGAAAVVVVLLIAGLWYAMRTPAPIPGPVPSPGPDPGGKPVITAVVTIDAAPWANVTISPVGGGNPHDCTTPCTVELPAGDYDLAFENDGLSQPLSERLTVAGGAPQTLHRTMPGFDVDRAVSAIVGTPR